MLKSLLEEDTKIHDDSCEIHQTKMSTKNSPRFQPNSKHFFSSFKKSRTFQMYSKKLSREPFWEISATTMVLQ